MNRGYIKFWRKAQDSSSWNRGLMYQGLIINLLSRAAWKQTSYQGRDILPGQFGVVMGRLAESLEVPKTTLHRMVFHLAEDGFLTVENVGNRFTIITITNWHLYQEKDKESWNAGGTPVEHQRNAGGKPPYIENARDNCIKEVKKEEEDLNTPPHPPGGGECEAGETPLPIPQPKAKPRTPTGNTVPELRDAIAEYTSFEPLRAALEDFRLMRERIRKPMTGRALKLLFGELDKLAPDDAGKIAVLEQSIFKSWQGVFAVSGNARASPVPKSYAQHQDAEQREMALRQLRKREAKNARQGNDTRLPGNGEPALPAGNTSGGLGTYG